jgi:hypothetical protein
MVKRMALLWKLAFPLLAAYLLVVNIVPHALADKIIDTDEERSHQELLLIQHGTISANLEGVPLGEILRQLRDQSTIWYRGNEPLLEQKVSVRFKDLPLEDGVKRILAPFNYSLMFDANGGLSGMILLGRSHTDRDMAIQTTVTSKRSSPPKILNRDTMKGSFDTIRTSSSPENPRAKPVVRSIIGEIHSIEDRKVKPMVPRNSMGSLSSSSPNCGRPPISLGISHHMINPMTGQ